MTGKPFSFRDLPMSAFPFTVEYCNADTGEVLHMDTVAGPGVLEVPPLGKIHSCPIRTRVTFADGEVVEV